MSSSPLQGLALTGSLHVGLPPRANVEMSPLGWFDAFLVLVAVVLGLWWSYKATVWLDVKIAAMQLFREIYRELRRNHRPGGQGGPA